MKNYISDHSQKVFKKFLQQIVKSEPSSLRSEVAEEALEYHDPASFFTDLLQHGCISGMVGKLIYYTEPMTSLITTIMK